MFPINWPDEKKIFDVEVEVVELRLEREEMRIKYTWPEFGPGRDGTYYTTIPITSFFREYEITHKD